jgi:quercetin dioxygenase-like cupin family protein
MQAHDIRAALSSVPLLTITSSTTAAEAAAAFPRLASFNQGGVFVGTFSGQSPWERHPHGDELLHVLEGEVNITLLTEDGPAQTTIGAGHIFVVPKGVWHRQRARVTVSLLSATPQPTEVSWAEDPRRHA